MAKTIKPVVSGSKVTFGPCRLSYASLFEKKKFDGDQGDGKYMTNVLIPKDYTDTLAAIDKAVAAAKADGITRCWGGKEPRNLKIALYDGDDKEAAEYHGCMFINPKSSVRPVVLDRQRQPVMDPDQVYSGCWAIVSVTFFAYSKSGNGIGCLLNGVQKWRDDEAFGGNGGSAKDFETLDTTGLDDDDDL